MISKYDAVQEIRIGTPESSDSIKRKVPKFSVGKRKTNSGRDGDGDGGSFSNADHLLALEE